MKRDSARSRERARERERQRERERCSEKGALRGIFASRLMRVRTPAFISRR